MYPLDCYVRWIVASVGLLHPLDCCVVGLLHPLDCYVRWIVAHVELLRALDYYTRWIVTSLDCYVSVDISVLRFYLLKFQIYCGNINNGYL